MGELSAARDPDASIIGASAVSWNDMASPSADASRVSFERLCNTVDRCQFQDERLVLVSNRLVRTTSSSCHVSTLFPMCTDTGVIDVPSKRGIVIPDPDGMSVEFYRRTGSERQSAKTDVEPYLQ